MTTPTFTTEGTALDVLFFDITGAKDGDTFLILASWLAPGGIELVKAEAPAGTFDFRGGRSGELFHGRIAPLAGCSIKGMLWSQGERNGGQVRSLRSYRRLRRPDMASRQGRD